MVMVAAAKVPRPMTANVPQHNGQLVSIGHRTKPAAVVIGSIVPGIFGWNNTRQYRIRGAEYEAHSRGILAGSVAD